MNEQCHNCGCTDLKALYTAPAFDLPLHQATASYALARCSACQLVNTTGANPQQVAEAYTTEYYGSASSKFLSVIERVVSHSRTMHARKITRAWQRGQAIDRPPSVLDIGCGRGLLLQAFQSIGATVLGLERQEFPIDDSGAGMVCTGSLADPEYIGRKFDIIILWHVLEHVDKQGELFDTISEHLNKDGLLIVAVPNFSSLQQRVFNKHWFHLDLPRHIVHIESSWLQRLLIRRGYAVESVNYVDTLQNVFGFIQSALNVISPDKMNDYYRLLKHGLTTKKGTVFEILKWSFPALLLLPFAIFETLLGALTHNGATVQVIARWEEKL